MKMIFDRNGEGRQELVAALGMISDSLDYSKWKPVLPLAARQLTCIIGADVLSAIVALYWDEDLDPEKEELVFMAQRAVAYFAWVKVVPTLDAQHGGSGRQRKLGENEKGLTALQEYKDEMNILNLAYESVDALVGFLEEKQFDFWEKSLAKRQMDGLLIRTKDEFDEFYHIGSHRLFLILVPILREIQRTDILPVVGKERFDWLVRRDPNVCDTLLEECQRPLALLAIKKAVDRLPVEVIPEGIVQVQQTGTVKEKLRAEKEARKSVADSLQADADRYLQELQDTVAALDTAPEEVDFYVSGPTLQSKGITF